MRSATIHAVDYSGDQPAQHPLKRSACLLHFLSPTTIPFPQNILDFTKPALLWSSEISVAIPSGKSDFKAAVLFANVDKRPKQQDSTPSLVVYKSTVHIHANEPRSTEGYGNDARLGSFALQELLDHPTTQSNISGDRPTFSLQAALQCPKCFRVMGKGSNQTSLEQHMIGRGCKAVHAQMFPLNVRYWKYNFFQHLDEKNPSWRELIPSSFLPRIRISRAERRPQMPLPSTAGVPEECRGQKRSSGVFHMSPCRRNKENESPDVVERSSKSIRLNSGSSPFLSLPGQPSRFI
ncbi:hypothetical protein DFH09DRAFT_1096903 [Mycena vulgaris]|nr:hypothetical protein DFH09DRAFT_1096903 [Mycena vulgaris]